MSEERLQKYLARAGVASRRASERLIQQGLVKVNGTVVRELGTKVTPGEDVIEYDGRRIEADVRYVYLLLNKPTHVISAASDPEGRQVVTALVPPEFGRLYPVGRLDWDSEGALLLTNDGTLTQLLTHPKHEAPKTYMVKVKGMWSDSHARIDQVRQGVTLDDGYTTQPAVVVRDGDTGRHTWFVVTIKEGRNRQIRRMFASVHIDVLRLRRIAYGPVLLGDLPPAGFRRLSESEIEDLYETAGEKRPRTHASRGRLPSQSRKGKVAGMKKARKDARSGRRRGGSKG